MIRRLLALDAWAVSPVPASPMAFARMALGCIFLLAWATTAPRVEILWGSDGLVHHVLHAGQPQWTEWAWPGLLACALVGAFGMVLGLFTRLSCLLFFVGHVGLVKVFNEFTWGWGTAMPVFTLYLLFSEAGRSWSLDAWRTGGRTWQALRGQPTQPGWPWRLLVLNVACVYVSAGWHRIDDPSWIYGDIVWEAVTCSLWSRWVWVDWNPFKTVLWLGAYAAQTLEVLGAVLLLVPRIRPWWAVGCIALHVGLELTTSVGWWQWCMTALLFALVWPTVTERILDTVWRTRPPPQEAS